MRSLPEDTSVQVRSRCIARHCLAKSNLKREESTLGTRSWAGLPDTKAVCISNVLPSAVLFIELTTSECWQKMILERKAAEASE